MRFLSHAWLVMLLVAHSSSVDVEIDATEHSSIKQAWGAQFGLGVQLQQRGDLKGAEASFKNAIALEPHLPIAHMKLGYLQLGDQRHTQAMQSFRRVLDVDPKNAEAYFIVGFLLVNSNNVDVEGAISNFEQAIDIDPNLAHAHLNLGFLLENHRNDVAAAELAYRRAIEASPDLADAHFNLASLLQNKKSDDVEAEAQYRLALQANPQDPVTHLNLGYLLKKKGDMQGMRDSWRRVLELDPDHPSKEALMSFIGYEAS